ncbi:MAG: M56 family metallopeptidase [Pirellulales bacterium]
MFAAGFVGLTIRATVIMAIGLIAARLIERRSAVLAHRILAMTAICVLVLPVANFFGPRLEIWWPDWMAKGTALHGPLAYDDNPIALLAADERMAVQPQSPSVVKLDWSWFGIMMTLWVLGTVYALGRLSYAFHCLACSIARYGIPSDLDRQKVHSQARLIGVNEAVHVKLSSRDSMPMVCWIGRWILVLPANFESWSTEVKSATLFHELGHIARRDVWVDYLIQTVRCMLWWHPLVWQLQCTVSRLRELACDEWVLQTCGVSARAYSHALLDVVRLCQLDDFRKDNWQLATPMATKRELEFRLCSIASPERSKKVKRIWLAIGTLAIAVLGLGIAVFTLVDPGAFPRQSVDEWGNENPVMKSGGSMIRGTVTHNGQPVPGAKLKVIKSTEGKFDRLHAVLTTDEQGRYSITDMHPGERYRIEVSPIGDLMVRNWQYQSPYVVTVSGSEGDTIELPDAILVSNTQTLAGVVVDPAGKPVSGITVSANLASGQMLSRTASGQAPWVATDQQGRFRLSTLPDEPIELMAYKANASGGRIVHPCKVKVELNAKDIRMVFDPKLGTGIEDLDAK